MRAGALSLDLDLLRCPGDNAFRMEDRQSDSSLAALITLRGAKSSHA